MLTRWYFKFRLWWRFHFRRYTPTYSSLINSRVRCKSRVQYPRRLRRGVMIFVNPSTYKDERMKEL